MVKVSIRDYMPPYTTWMQVELEDGVCNASPRIENPEDKNQGRINNNEVNDAFGEVLHGGTSNDWD